MGDEGDVVEVNQQLLLSVSSTQNLGLVDLISWVLVSQPKPRAGSASSTALLALHPYHGVGAGTIMNTTTAG